MTDRTDKLLTDALAATDRILRFTAGQDLARYQADDLLRSAVERQFEVLGEALAQLRRYDPRSIEDFAGATKAIGLRNRLIHAYDRIDDIVVWGTVERDVVTLRDQLAERLGHSLPP